MPKTFAVVNFGCKVNRVESDTIAAVLRAHGCKIAQADDADIVVINSCAVTGEAETKTRKAVHHHLRRKNLEALYITGCSASLNQEDYGALDPRVCVSCNKETLPELILSHIDDAAIDQDANETALRVGDAFKARVDVKVQDGCDNACTYCIIHVARGKARSYDAERIVHEVDALVRAGTREVVLTGINLGAYKTHDTPNLSALLKRLLRETMIERIRLSSIEPLDITDELLQLIKKSNGAIAAHFHVPLQSGSSKVLSEMHRLYNAEEFKAIVDNAKSVLPNVSLTTDVICGFPGETDDDFNQTLEMCKSVGFSKIHVFRFSSRPGTPAHVRNDKVPADVINARASLLRELSGELRVADAKSRVGKNEYVFFESQDRGTTESYHQCVVKNGRKGELLLVHFEACDDTGILHGRLIGCEKACPECDGA
jgi:threonylcarbamoyladenosine tRNA methylthiotransferase MtaB